MMKNTIILNRQSIVNQHKRAANQHETNKTRR